MIKAEPAYDETRHTWGIGIGTPQGEGDVGAVPLAATGNKWLIAR